MLEANAYGLPFEVLLHFTYGELLKYIEFHRERQRHALQDQCIIAYRQAAMLVNSIASGEFGEVFQQFPYWTEDEILNIRAQQAITYFNQFE